MPGLGRYPCTSCHYVAGNRRMLARHAVLIHSEKVFKCPVCPFITRYAANWYRHKRDLHGLSKITTCEVCGFFANSTGELAQHKESEHPGELHLEKYEDKYTKEKIRLTADEVSSIEPEVSIVEEEVNNLKPDKKDVFDINNDLDLYLDEKAAKDESVTFSLPLNGSLDASLGISFASASGSVTPQTADMNDSSSAANLRPPRVRRSYSCDQCGLLTNNPREYLYHLRNIHGEKISIHECKYCIYASKHIQKLQRHCNLVHRQQLSKDPDYLKQLEAFKSKKPRPEMIPVGQPRTTNASQSKEAFRNPNMASSSKPPLRNRSRANMLKCSACSYQTRNKALLFHHEKTVHLKKRFYRCLQCGYVTNEKARYTKHIKYHSLPKMQCEYCFFKTAYKWNMDRHMKNHEAGAEGDFRCTTCNFTTSTKQSFKSHVTNHHDPTAADMDEQDEMEMNGQNESSEWEDIDIQDNEECDMPLDENGSFESYDFPESRENSEMVWKDGKVYPKTLKCRNCDFRAAWPFEMKKHEETHKSQKKHPCPLCGMRFEHIAWLTKHLRRVHRESTQAKNIAAAFDLLKPARRRPGKEYAADSVIPMFQEVIKQNNNNVGNSRPQDTNKNSMLSTLLKKPLQPVVPSSVNKFSSASYRMKMFSSNSTVSRQPRISSYYEKVNKDDDSTKLKKTVPTCSVCGYKTRWISELQRHMRVHSQEKPFHCHKCKYHCKWKGDLNRHLMKYHGIKVPSTNKKHMFQRIRPKKPSHSSESVSDWQPLNQEKRNTAITQSSARNNDQDCPLDLTLTKETFPHPYHSESIYDAYDFESFSPIDIAEPIDVVSLDSSSSPLGSFPSFRPPIPPHVKDLPYPPEELSPNGALKRKYQCPFCVFGTTTASRFHVHIVQHYNRRPFMCSVCHYNSNWEWDITKHIRLKGCRDKFHNKACVLLTDDTGRRNYEKYDKYLVDIDQQPKSPNVISRLPEMNSIPESEARFNANRINPTEILNKNCTYDFRNIGSNFEDTPVNIVVTPDINLPDTPEVIELERQEELLMDNQQDILEDPLGNVSDTKFFYCKHCNFKHSTKRVVISHLSIHAGLKPFRCRACGLTSNWRHVIVRHVKDTHNGYMNDVEDRINFVQEGYAIRLTSINSGGRENGNIDKSQQQQFGCKICPYKCDKEFYIKFHMKQHRPREGAIYRCDFCPYFVKFKKTLVRHMKLHVPSTDDNVTDNTLLSDSVENSESQSQMYSNDVYDFYDSQANDSADDSIPISFEKLNELNTIEQTSPQKIKRHVCENCPYKTDNKTQYLYHKQFHRPNPTAPFKCSVCSYWATMQHLLTQHMRVHSDTDPESERQTNYQRNRKASLEQSLELDLDDEKISVIYVKRGDLVVKMFKCQFCPMMNKKKANVRVHQKMHGVIVNNGKFACTYCNYQCLNQGGLTNHIKIHQKVPEKEAYPDENMIELDGDNKKTSFDAGDEVSQGRNRKGFSYFCMKCPAVFKSASDLQIHKKFHGSSLPYPCTHCDYRAKHKPHLFKHLTVHTPEYEEKRNASQAPPVNPSSSVTDFTDSVDTRSTGNVVKKIDQMLLLEASEVKASLEKTGEMANNLHKCVFCPASLFKSSTLAYHISLHGSDGEYTCSQCDYRVSRSSNLTVHALVHPKKTPAKRAVGRSFPCPKCPAVFYKQDRYDRHFSLHGKNSKFACDQCDYSVRFAANLIKHKALHAAKKDTENLDLSPKNSNNTQVSPSHSSKPLSENTNAQETEEKKTTFICDRCPYFQTRKDAVQSHQRRHWLKDGFKCPYCDYSSMQNSFLQSHIKMHIQPNHLFPAQAFMKYESFKIWCKDDGEDVLLFDDENLENHIQDAAPETVAEDISEKKVSKEILKPPKIRKKAHDILKIDDALTDSNSSDVPSKPKVPVVILSDIFANDKNLKKLTSKLKIPKLKISKCAGIASAGGNNSERGAGSKSNDHTSSQESSRNENFKKSLKPSLVVKIKVENRLVNMHEKTTYSVKPSESIGETFTSLENGLESTENTNDSTSDIIFRDSDPSLQTVASISPVPEDIEECTLTSNSGLEDSMKVADESVEVDSIIDSIVGPETDTEELIISQPANEISDVKSEESFSNDTVPVVVGDILCEKLGNLTELPFKNDLSITNGDCSSHLTNGLSLLPEEIKVKL